MPIENGEVFLRKIRVKAEDLGTEDWVDLKLAMNQSFVPKELQMNTDERVLGLLVYHLYVGRVDELGKVPEGQVVDAVPLAAAAEKAKPKKG
jgi:hypothetical protein